MAGLAGGRWAADDQRRSGRFSRSSDRMALLLYGINIGENSA